MLFNSFPFGIFFAATLALLDLEVIEVEIPA